MVAESRRDREGGGNGSTARGEKVRLWPGMTRKRYTKEVSPTQSNIRPLGDNDTGDIPLMISKPVSF